MRRHLELALAQHAVAVRVEGGERAPQKVQRRLRQLHGLVGRGRERHRVDHRGRQPQRVVVAEAPQHRPRGLDAPLGLFRAEARSQKTIFIHRFPTICADLFFHQAAGASGAPFR